MVHICLQILQRKWLRTRCYFKISSYTSGSSSRTLFRVICLNGKIAIDAQWVQVVVMLQALQRRTQEHQLRALRCRQCCHRAGYLLKHFRSGSPMLVTAGMFLDLGILTFFNQVNSAKRTPPAQLLDALLRPPWPTQ